MSMTTENSIKLRDGRKLGYAEYGDPNGRPVLHFHGFPSSRYEGCRTASDEIATRLRARVIVVERPGFGLSDFKVGRTIVDWPSDVVEFADALRRNRALGWWPICGHMCVEDSAAATHSRYYQWS